MFQININFKDIEGAIELLEKYPEVTDKNIEDVFNIMLPEIESRAKHLAPVDTGTLRDRIGWRIEKAAGVIKGIIEDKIFYAGFVHEGTRKMKARPFIRSVIMTYAIKQGKRELERNYLKFQRGFSGITRKDYFSNPKNRAKGV